MFEEQRLAFELPETIIFMDAPHDDTILFYFWQGVVGHHFRPARRTVLSVLVYRRQNWNYLAGLCEPVKEGDRNASKIFSSAT